MAAGQGISAGKGGSLFVKPAGGGEIARIFRLLPQAQGGEEMAGVKDKAVLVLASGQVVLVPGLVHIAEVVQGRDIVGGAGQRSGEVPFGLGRPAEAGQTDPQGIPGQAVALVRQEGQLVFLDGVEKIPLAEEFVGGDIQGLPTWLAQYIVYDRHSEAGAANKWNSVADLEAYLDEFKQHSLRK